MSRTNLALVPDLDGIGMPRDQWGDLTPNGSPRCKGMKGDRRCLSFAGRSGYCFNHDPAIDKERRREAKANGGRNTSRLARAQKLLPPRLRTVFDRLDSAMVEVVEGTLSPVRASALAALASASVRVLQAGEFEEELRRLRAAVGEDADFDAVPTDRISEVG
jgi:hypothetical protein